nr:proteoglycan 4-like [Tanacetum cinerariifolium]
SRTNIKLLPPENTSASEWFTTTTLKRFLRILGLSDILSIGNEIGQLEETRKFQLSLSVKAEVDITSSINSKNELLRAVDLRLIALKDEVAAAFDQAIGGRCSTKDISNLENFAHHFGAKDIRDSLQKFLEMSLFPTAEDSRNSNFSKTETSALGPQASQLVPPIKYNVPPEKVAQAEQQDSIEMENSPFSSEEDQLSVERSCAPIRSTTPRRSASPMRRIQIGRSGSRRVTALTIKSLNYIPVREKVAFQRDAGNSSDEEDPEKPSKNVLRMSVQDKISLFESKQRDQQVDIPKTKKLLKITGGPNKTVLRRWSSGIGESQVSSISPHNVAVEAESNLRFMESQICDSNSENIKPHSSEPEPRGVNGDTLQTGKEESCEKHPASIEWNHQKEAELKDLFTNMMENKNKPVRNRNSASDVISENKKSPNEQRGGFNDHYKQKRDENLKVEAFGKNAEKESQSKVMQMVSTNVIEPQKTPWTNSRNEPSKPSVLKKNTSKMSDLPATRKSWSSSPAPSYARTPTGPTARSTTPTSRKPQPVLLEVRSTTKSETSQPRSKNLKATASDASRTLKTNNEKKQPTVTKITKTRIPEVNTAAKPSFYNNVTKKSSVVSLDTKSFLLKGSGIGPGVGPIGIETKVVGQPEEASRTSETLIEAVEDEVVMTPDISENHEECEAPEYQVVVSPVKVVVPAGPSSPRVRHSLSQILLEENSEEADNCEWGNAEHPPSLIYQKDSPKGLKRLLKFARKNKADSCTEGDNDAKDSKGARRTRRSFFNTKKR